MSDRRDTNRKYFQEWYHNKGGKEYTKNNRKPRSVRTQQARELRQKKKDLVIRELGGRCSDCKGVFNRDAYDFHHSDPNKKEGGLSFHWSLDRILKEVEGCVLLCALCHRARHRMEHK